MWNDPVPSSGSYNKLQVVLRVRGMARVPGKGLGPGTDPLPDQGLGALRSHMRALELCRSQEQEPG